MTTPGTGQEVGCAGTWDLQVWEREALGVWGFWRMRTMRCKHAAQQLRHLPEHTSNLTAPDFSTSPCQADAPKNPDCGSRLSPRSRRAAEESRARQRSRMAPFGRPPGEGPPFAAPQAQRPTAARLGAHKPPRGRPFPFAPAKTSQLLSLPAQLLGQMAN